MWAEKSAEENGASSVEALGELHWDEVSPEESLSPPVERCNAVTRDSEDAVFSGFIIIVYVVWCVHVEGVPGPW